ncbi:MAG: polysaccharide deacetylase family protein [Paracoccaceae bacterium]
MLDDGGAMQDDRRDLRGYWDGAPPPPWPNAARVAVSFVVNVEEGAERSIGDGDPVNESVYEAAEEVRGSVDPCMESHYGYGPRAGYRRIVDALDQAGAVATFSTCGRAAVRTPWLMQDIIARGHEVGCHGWLWETHSYMDEATERETIAKTHAELSRITGHAPVGWHTRSASSANTRRLLLEHGGFLYDSDAYDDDIPRIERHGDTDHVVLPYAFDTNDMRFRPGGAFVHAEDFSRYCIAAFDRLWEEGRAEARMMSIGLHLRTIGRPARIGGLEAVLAHMTAKGGAWMASRRQIAECWRAASGLPEWTRKEPT